MLTQLVESKPVSRRSTGGTAMAVVAHCGLILLAIYTSAGTAGAASGPRVEKVRFVEPANVKPAEPKAQAPELAAAPLPVRLAPSLIAPLEIPTVLPDIDLSRAPADPGVFDGERGPSSPPNPAPNAAGSPRPDRAWFEHEVEKPVVQAPNSATPAYPDILRQAGVEGHALVSFVVDTAGRVDVSTFKVIHSTHELFTSAVRSALPRMRFFPAEASRGRVRQLVQQPFSFAIVR